MIQGLYTAANGMVAVESRQAGIAHNIANASTHGFKRQMAVHKGYYGDYMGSKSPSSATAPGGGVEMTETFSNFSGGAITKTGSPLDVALLGDGFVQVQTCDQTLLTSHVMVSSIAVG